MAENEDPTTGEGASEVRLILRDEMVRSIMNHLTPPSENLTQEERAELLSAFIRATGAAT